jgi:hypothetical protein
MAPGIRTEWHLAELVTTGDPFEGTAYSGVEIRLDGSVAELSINLQRLLDQEEGLFKFGLTCDLKDAGQDCRSCPMATVNPDERRSALCRLGKDQCALSERIETVHAPLQEIGEHVGVFMEMGQLDGEYAELLEAVGL